ncbi:MAG: aspartate aminotransferase family protein [Chloroflexaceae bacterium]|nr:aspartate aminotransferase family protein [Chloroflexaceae bacterium]
MWDETSLQLLANATNLVNQGFSDLPAYDTSIDVDALQPVLLEVARRLQENDPYHHPLYAGQMLKPPHVVARIAYALAMTLNPNNHALEGGLASSRMEQEAVADIAAMVGWPTYLGHLTGGGTMANLEALWVASQITGRTLKIVASKQAHYTHQRLSGVLGLPFKAIATDKHLRMDIDALKHVLEQGDVGTVVVTLGTTATGSVDPLADVLELQQNYDFRVHVDAAYGGYAGLVSNLSPEVRRAYDCLAEADSIAIDPHKQGLQPYGCGCILFKDPSVGQLYKHDSPYTYFSSNELHLGEISLECSRPGAAAVALWATQRLLPLVPGGQFAQQLEQSHTAALELSRRLKADRRFLLPFEPDLDIVVWAIQPTRVSRSSEQARQLLQHAAQQHLHLALVDMPLSLFEQHLAGVVVDQNHITCIRSCLFKPEHADWIDAIWQRIDQAYEAARKP